MSMPIIGKYISKVLTEGDDTLLQRDRENWKWRPETSHSRDNKQRRYGDKGVVTDLRDVGSFLFISFSLRGNVEKVIVAFLGNNIKNVYFVLATFGTVSRTTNTYVRLSECIRVSIVRVSCARYTCL